MLCEKQPLAGGLIYGGVMSEDQILSQEDASGVRDMLSGSGYSEKAIKYYIDKPYMGILSDASQVTEMTGTCGDTMKVFLKVEQGKIADARYEVLGCPGAVAAAMAAVELVKGKSLEIARSIDDGNIFTILEDIPAKKHHCIQLAVKALHLALDELQAQ